jgi:hypothetical protein
MMLSSSRVSRNSDSEKSGTAARHSLLKSSITLRMRNRRPLASWSLTKFSDQRWFTSWIDLLQVHLRALPLEHPRQAPVAEAPADRGQRPQPLAQRTAIWLMRPVPITAHVHSDQPAGSARAQSVDRLAWSTARRRSAGLRAFPRRYPSAPPCPGGPRPEASSDSGSPPPGTVAAWRPTPASRRIGIASCTASLRLSRVGGKARRAPAVCRRRISMICYSLKRFRFIVRSPRADSTLLRESSRGAGHEECSHLSFTRPAFASRRLGWAAAPCRPVPTDSPLRGSRRHRLSSPRRPARLSCRQYRPYCAGAGRAS